MLNHNITPLQQDLAVCMNVVGNNFLLLHDGFQVNARNAERALNQEKLESSKLRQR